MSGTRNDAFLGGRLNICQPVDGYRAGADPVFLAAAVSAKPGQQVLELGCGVGTAMCCLLSRVPGLPVTGVERDPGYAALARKNATVLDSSVKIVEADILDLPMDVTEQSFDHVFFNPPFFDRKSGTVSENQGREVGRGGDVTLAAWIKIGLQRTRSGGLLTLIHRTEFIPDVINALDSRAGDIRILPLQPRRNRASKLFILQAKKGSRGVFKLLPPFVLHKGDAHKEDGDSYTDAASAILRDGAPLSLSN